MDSAKALWTLLKSECHTDGVPVLKKLLLRTLPEDLGVVCVVDIKGVVVFVGVRDDIRVFTPGLAPVCAHHDSRTHPVLHTCAILQSELEDAAAVQGRRIPEVECSFDQTDVLQAQTEWPRWLFQWGSVQGNELEHRTHGSIGSP